MAKSDDDIPGVATWRDYVPEEDRDGEDAETAVPEQSADDKPKTRTTKPADKPKEG